MMHTLSSLLEGASQPCIQLQSCCGTSCAPVTPTWLTCAVPHPDPSGRGYPALYVSLQLTCPQLQVVRSAGTYNGQQVWQAQGRSPSLLAAQPAHARQEQTRRCADTDTRV